MPVYLPTTAAKNFPHNITRFIHSHHCNKSTMPCHRQIYQSNKPSNTEKLSVPANSFEQSFRISLTHNKLTQFLSQHTVQAFILNKPWPFKQTTWITKQRLFNFYNNEGNLSTRSAAPRMPRTLQLSASLAGNRHAFLITYSDTNSLARTYISSPATTTMYKAPTLISFGRVFKTP